MLKRKLFYLFLQIQTKNWIVDKKKGKELKEQITIVCQLAPQYQKKNKEK